MQFPRVKVLRALEVVAWSAFFAFALVFLALRYWVLPSVETHRAEIVAEISRAIGLPVKIGALATSWQGLRPRISISDVHVYDRDGREALVLPSVENVVSWSSLLTLQLRLYSFVIDQPRLAVRRDARGQIYVAGIRVAGESGDGKLADWILHQHRIEIRGAEVEWRDELRGAPLLALSDLNFRLDNDGDRHAVGISARPPRELGPGLELRAVLEGASVKQLARWNGRLYAEFGYTDLAAWRAWVDYPLDVRRGEGALRLWGTFSAGRITQATADVALSGVSARLGKDLPVLEVAAVRGRIFGRQLGRGYEFGVRNLALSGQGSAAMKATSFRASWEPAGDRQPQHGTLSANLIELGPLAHLAEFLPFPADLRRLLAELSPQGNLLDAKFDWTGELPDRAVYSGRTRFTGLTMNAWRRIPGFARLSGSVEANERKGALYLASRRSDLDLPKVFPEPRIHFDTLNGEVDWSLAPGGTLAVRLANVSFANDDLAGTANGSYEWNGAGPGVVDLSAQLSRADGRSTARYLPLSSIMGEHTRQWVASAVLAGQASDARLRLKGDLRDFPFADPAKGQFQVAAHVSNAVLDYAEGWPRIEAIDGELMFERERIEVVGRSASILGATLENVRVTVPSLLEPQKHLIIEGRAAGPTTAFFDYIRKSPVQRMVGGLTDRMSATGDGRLHLRLDLPLGDLAKSKVAGEFDFAGNRVSVDPRLPPIERGAGRVGFTESSLALRDVRGQIFGGEVRISGGSRPDAGVRVVAEGRATVDGMRTLLDHPWRRRLSGSARYTATVTVKDGRAQIGFDTMLEGVASTLPPPLAKAAADSLPLSVEVYPGDGRDRISLQVGPPKARILGAEFLRAGKDDALQVQRALVTLSPPAGETPSIPERRGTTVRGSLPALDLDRWLPLLGEGGAGEGAAFDVKIGVLDALGKRMHDVSLQGVTEPGGWTASVSAQSFAGDLLYHSESGGKLTARFSRFTLPPDVPGTVTAADTKDLPAVDIVADDFVHRGRKLGRVEIQAHHEGSDWRIEKLAMKNPDSSLTGSGLWKPGEKSTTSLGFKLEVSDIGKFLDRMGYGQHVKGGHGNLEGQLRWNGDPVMLDYATLSGSLQMQVQDGQFLEIEPGIGKLVALMSLQMLPRRITLDFRDVFSKGFKFDRIASSLDVQRGVMKVKDFSMRGPAADVSMTGQVDLTLETENLKVTVVPQLGDSASTVVGLVNPVAGVATLVAGRLLKNPLGKIFAYDYAITGTWTDPKVEKLEPPPPPRLPDEYGRTFQ